MSKVLIKFLFILIAIILQFAFCEAQQRPQYTQYIFNNYIINPAISGIENYTDVKIGYRNQWQGLNGAPVTSYVSVHTPIGKKFIYNSAGSFSEGGGSNPMNRSYVQTYKASESHHGVGFHAVMDKAGPIVTSNANITYAYHLGLSERMNVAVGIAAGVSMIGLNYSDEEKLILAPDPALRNYENRIQPDLGAGVWLYGPTYFAGISAQNLLGRPISFAEESEEFYGKGKEVPHLYLTGGYKFFLAEDIAAIPSTMIKYVSPAPLTVDVNMKVAFMDRFWIGGSYRKDDAVSGMAGFNLGSLFNLSYSYDFTTSDLQSVNNGSHEIVLGLLLNNRYKVTCPQKNW